MQVDPNDIKYAQTTKVSVTTKNKPDEDGNRSEFYRVTIPQEIYRSLGLKRGDKVCWISFKNGVVTVTKAHRPQDK